ncbi:MAG: sugar phosphate isomerase/epimerase [Armatimonadetes bacterium]|nr:sugar phosphate isomerase/epimerase [Armatimonadota bacterium]
MRLGCAAYSYRDLLLSGEMTLEQFIDTCAAMGLDGVELTAYYLTDTSRDTLNALKRYCFRRGMHILGTAVGSNFTQSDDAALRQHIQMTKDWIDHSAVLGAPCIRVFAGHVPPGSSEEEAFERCVACLQECVAYAAPRGVMVALENHHGITTTAFQVLRLAAAVDNPWFGLNLDFGNFHEDPYREFEQVAHLAVTTHAKVTWQSGQERRPVDYARVAQIMAAVGYQGYLSVEYEEREDPRTGVPRFVEELHRALVQ